jgi:primosomal protein N' (replication factor Y)
LPLDDGVSAPLRAAIAATLASGNQVLLFINRRGYAPAFVCTRCGWYAGCPRCESRLTLHQTPPGLRCHHCGFAPPLPNRCPDCGDPSLRAVGVGTQRSEAGIARNFPGTPVLRIDRDSTRSAARMAAHLELIARGEPAVLVGTQMLAKGHHFRPSHWLAGSTQTRVCQCGFSCPRTHCTADHSGQAVPDARTSRRGVDSDVQPEQSTAEALVNTGMPDLRKPNSNNAQRRVAAAARNGHIMADGTTTERTMSCLTTLQKVCATHVEVLGLIAAPLARRARRFRCQTLLLAAVRAHLHDALDAPVRAHGQSRFPGVRWVIDVDPHDMSDARFCDRHASL